MTIRNKRGVEAVWIIVMLVLALIVLVVLTAILTGQAGKFGKGLNSTTKGCIDLGGTEEAIAAVGCPDGKEPILGANVQIGYVCCK